MPATEQTGNAQTKLEQKLIIFTDGGARGNPGPAGIGAVFYVEDSSGSQVRTGEIKKYIGEATNNFAEYTALITALEGAAQYGHKRVECFLDSELVVKQLTGKYKIREGTLKPLAAKVLALTNKFEQINFTHVPREKNHEADKLVNQAIDQAIGQAAKPTGLTNS